MSPFAVARFAAVAAAPPSGPVTWDPVNKGADVALSSGNLIANVTHDTQQARGTSGKTSGKWYFEIHVGTLTDRYGIAGLADITTSASAIISSVGMAYHSNGDVESGVGGATWYRGDVLGFAMDLTGATPQFDVYVNNVFSATKSGISGVSWCPAVAQNYGPGSNFPFTLCPDAATQTYSPPAGFLPYS